MSYETNHAERLSERMLTANPRYVLRHHIAQEAIAVPTQRTLVVTVVENDCRLPKAAISTSCAICFLCCSAPSCVMQVARLGSCRQHWVPPHATSAAAVPRDSHRFAFSTLHSIIVLRLHHPYYFDSARSAAADAISYQSDRHSRGNVHALALGYSRRGVCE